VIARLVAHAERLHMSDNIVAAQRQFVGREIRQRVAAPLRLQEQRECRIAANVDPRDGVHLDGDVQYHAGDPWF